jgi:hypothetical protein
VTKGDLLSLAKTMAQETGLINLSRQALCDRAEIAPGSFSYYSGCTFNEFVAELKDELTDGRHIPVTKARANPELRKCSILDAAVDISRSLGYANISRQQVADRAGVSTGLVTKYFGTMQQLRRAIIRAAIAREIPEIIAQGMACSDRHVMKAPDELKAAARLSI